MPAINVIPGLQGQLEYSIDGTTFSVIPGIENISLSGGEAPEADVVTFEGVAKVVGHPRVPTIQATVSAYNPQHSTWRAINLAGRNRAVLTWRFTSKEESFFTATGAGNTVAIAVTGVVTFAGDAPDFASGRFAPGMTIAVGGASYVIDVITAAGAVTVKPVPVSAVAAAMGYKINNPALRLGPLIATGSVTGAEMSSEGQLTATLNLAPRAQLPDWAIV